MRLPAGLHGCYRCRCIVIRQIFADQPFVEISHQAVSNTTTAIEQAETIADFAGKRQFLFDQ